jgi:hypothetical protein
MEHFVAIDTALTPYALHRARNHAFDRTTSKYWLGITPGSFLFSCREIAQKAPFQAAYDWFSYFNVKALSSLPPDPMEASKV